MQADEIRKLLREIDSPGSCPAGKPVKFIHIVGYVDSQNNTSNIILRKHYDASTHRIEGDRVALPEYYRCMASSLWVLENSSMERDNFQNLVTGSEAFEVFGSPSKEALEEAKSQLIVSWQSSLDAFENAEGGDKHIDNARYTFNQNGAYYDDVNDENVVVLRHRREVTIRMPTKTSIPKSELARAKALIKHCLLIGRYIPQLNLKEGKFERIQEI